MAEFDRKSHFAQAAQYRLKDAEELLEPPSRDRFVSDANRRHLRSSMYLAGYAVECILKAYVVSQVPNVERLSEAVRRRRDAGEEIPDIQGNAGHDLITLLLLTDLEPQIQTNRKILSAWTTCLKWKSTWRYDPSAPTREQAEEFVSAVRRFHDWVKPRSD